MPKVVVVVVPSFAMRLAHAQENMLDGLLAHIYRGEHEVNCLGEYEHSHCSSITEMKERQFLTPSTRSHI